MHAWPARLETGLGAALMAAALLDLFITVLYARIGGGRDGRLGMGGGRLVAQAVWRLACALDARLPGRGAVALSAAAPVMLVAIIAMWAGGLTIGAALVVHPSLGHGLAPAAGPVSTDFVTALYVAESSLSLLSATDVLPQTTGLRLFFMADAFIGASVLALTLTYVMQIYQALVARNALGLAVEAQSEGTNQAAVLLARWGPLGRFDIGAGSMASVADALAHVYESHHLYPLLFYFRFESRYANPALYLPMLLEAVTLARCALDAEAYGWLQGSAVASQLRDHAGRLMGLLERVFVPVDFVAARADRTEAAWRARFRMSLEVLGAAGIRTCADVDAGCARYVALMQEWEGGATRVAAYLGHEEAALPRAPDDASEAASSR